MQMEGAREKQKNGRNKKTGETKTPFRHRRIKYFDSKSKLCECLRQNWANNGRKYTHAFTNAKDRKAKLNSKIKLLQLNRTIAAISWSSSACDAIHSMWGWAFSQALKTKIPRFDFLP